MADDLNMLGDSLRDVLAEKVVGLENILGELTLIVDASNLNDVLTLLRDEPKFRFEQLIDLCGVDYSAYGSDVVEDGVYPAQEGKSAFPGRFAVIYHLLSVQKNQRLRVKIYAKDDELPVLDSSIHIWSAADWYEREAFDLYGIIFVGHPDLRRILTDYGFVGNPFRKDFPLSGHVEMRYDPAQQRVVYQPVSIESRVVTPRIVREETYGCN